MNKIYTKIVVIFLLGFIGSTGFSQNSLINYQAAARRADGSGIANKTISVKFEILQGSATGSVLVTETQTVQTTNLGLFATQIGISTNLGLINWQSSSHFLKIGIDTTGGSDFLNLGTQQFVSVPYAIQSENVPSTYTNNVLSIGKNTYTLNSSPSYTSGTGIAIISGSIVNTSPDQTVAISGGTNVAVVGTYPNFTISATPSLSVNGNSLDISGGNTVTLPTVSVVSSGAAVTTTLGLNSYSIDVPQPTLSVNGNSIAISGGNSIPLPSAPSASVVSSGAAVTTTLGTNSYSINVPQPTLTANGNSITISGGNTVSLTTTPNTSLVASGAVALTTLGINSYSLNVPQPTLSLINNSLSVNGSNTVTLPTNPTITGQGMAAVSPTTGSVFTVSVPNPTLVYNTGTLSITGGNAVNIPVTPNTSLVASGAAAVATLGTNSYSIDVPQPTLTATGNSISISGGNTVTLSIPPTTSLVGTGAVAVTTLASNSYSLNVPQPTLTLSNNTLTINGGNTVTVSPTLAYNSGTLTVGPATNTILVPAPITPSIVGAGIAAVSPTAGNAFTVTVNQPTFAYSQTTGSLTSGTSSAFATPSLTINGATITSGPASNSINLSSISPWSVSGSTVVLANPSNNVGVGTANPHVKFEVDGDMAIPSINKFVFGTPTSLGNGEFIKNTGIGAFGLGFYANSILRMRVANSGQVGIGTGTLAPAGLLEVLGTNTTTSNILKITNTNSTSAVGAIDVQSNGAIGVAVNNTNATGFGMTLNSIGTGLSVTNSGPSHAIFATNTNTASLTSVAGFFDGGIWTRGKTNTSSAFAIFAQDVNSNTLFTVRNDGYVGVGTTALTGMLTVDNQSITTRTAVFIDNARDFIGAGMPAQINITTAGQTYGTNTYGRILRIANPGQAQIADIGLDNNGSFFISRSGNYFPATDFAITSSGNVGIGVNASNAPLQFANTTVNRKIVMWEGANNDHQFYGFGINASTLRYQVDNVAADHVFYAGTSSSTSNEVFRIKGNGLMKMGTETGTGQPANYPSGGMMMRRISTTNFTAGEIIARTDLLTFERDGTNGGFRITRSGGNGKEVCNCTAVTSGQTNISKMNNDLATGTTNIFSNTDNVVFIHCIFGAPYVLGHQTEITLTREFPDYFWVGTIITTFNQ